MALLQIDDMTHYFGGLRAVHNYNVTIVEGQIRGLIGPNGAGKTTVFNLITGIYKPTEGTIRFQGQDIAGRFPHDIAAMGIARTFQNMRLWRHLTVLEHVQLAHSANLGYGLAGAFFGTGRRQLREAEIKEHSMHLLEIMGVRRWADEVVINLPYGVQRRVEMARALATDPKLLLLDEPTAGMTPEELLDMVQVIRQLNQDLGLAILLIEHRMKVVMDLCQIVQTLNFGEVIAEGTPEEIRNNPQVIEAYLGKEVIT